MDKNLRIRMLLEAADKVTKPLRNMGAGSTKAARALEKTRDRLREIGRAQENIKRFTDAGQRLRETGRTLQATQDRFEALAKQIAETDKPTKALLKDFDRAQKQTRDLSEQYSRETRQLNDARDALDKAGISTRNLVRDERALREEAARTADVLERQTNQAKRAARVRGTFQAGRAAFSDNVHRASSSAVAGTTMVAEGVGLAEALKKPIEAAVDLQDKLAGVRKVAQMESPEIQQMQRDYLKLSQTMPIAADEFADMAEKAAAAGVGRQKDGTAMKDQRKQIEDFTVQAGKMAIAYNISKEEAGTTMMAWREAFGLPLPKLVALGDQVNTLNKYFGGTPSEIDDVLERIGPLGKVAGAQAAQIAAMGSSLSSLHVPSEVAATGIKNVLVQFNAGDSATKKLRKAYKALGLDAVTVAKRMQADAGSTIIDVFTRINRLPKFKQVAELRNMFGKESITSIAPLLANLQGLKERLEKVGNATEYAGSVQKEYNIRKDTTAYRLKQAQINFKNLQIAIGNDLLPEVDALAISFSNATKSITDFASRHPRLIRLVAGLVATLAGLLIVGGGLLLLRAGVMGLLIPFQVVAAAAGALEIGLLPMYGMILAGVAAVALLAAGAYLLYRNWGQIKGFFGGLWNEISAGFHGGIGGITRLLTDFSPVGLLYRGFSALMNWLGVSMPARLSDAGLYMMQGLARGITGALGTVKDAISGAADATVNWFKAKLGIHSPSRVFHGFGGFMMQGLSNGIDAGKGAPVRRIGVLSRQIVASMGGATTGASLGRMSRRVGTALAIGAATPAIAGNSHPIGAGAGRAPAPAAQPAKYEFHIHQQPGQSAEDLAKAIRKELERHERAKAAQKRSSYADAQDWS